MWKKETEREIEMEAQRGGFTCPESRSTIV